MKALGKMQAADNTVRTGRRRRPFGSARPASARIPDWMTKYYYCYLYHCYVYYY